MKYLLHDWGVDKFRSKVEEYFGKSLQPYRELPQWKYQDYLGWNDRGDGKLFLGISVENGRVKDDGNFCLKTALRQIVEQFQLPMRLTPNHNIIFDEIEPGVKEKIQDILERNGVVTNPENIDPLTRYSMACPAFPTCGLAITESERALPGIVDRIRTLLDKLGLGDEKFVIRMTGCPNGCARPYMAELGFVGSAPNAYQIWLGGTPDQTKLARAYVEKLPIADLETFLEPLFVYFKQDKKSGESFGEFCDRVGFNALREFSATYKPSKPSTKGRKICHRVGLYDEMYERIKQAARDRGKSMTELVAEALEAYL
jgi:sulfite reductase (ferredoxin)